MKRTIINKHTISPPKIKYTRRYISTNNTNEKNYTWVFEYMAYGIIAAILLYTLF